jgi:hypothetical protein
MSRLITSLCQILGLQARPAFFWVGYDPQRPGFMLGGHTVVEVQIDGKWGFFDPMCRVYCQTADGRFPSVREILEDPTLFTRMPESVKKRQRPWLPSTFPEMDDFEYYAYRFFTKRIAVSITRHEVTDTNSLIRWTWATKEFREKQERDHKKNKQVLLPLGDRDELPDEIYRMNVQEFRARFGIEGELPGQWEREKTSGSAARGFADQASHVAGSAKPQAASRRPATASA